MTQQPAAKPNANPGRVDAWTSIRALAAIWVVLFHLENYSMKLDFGWLTPFIQRGELGVDLFFMLSGLVISYVHQAEFTRFQTATAVRFWVLRFARIYPLHLLMLLVMAVQEQSENLYSWFVCQHGPAHQPGSIQDFCLSLLNIHSWETTGKLSFNYPSWSVSAEWFAYLLFPLITPFILRIRSVGQNLLLIAISLFCLVLTCWLNHEQSFEFTYHLGLVRVTTEFITGCGLYNLLKAQKSPLPYANALILSCIALIPVLLGLHTNDIWVVVVMGALLYLLPLATGWVKQLFAIRLLVFGGEISYAVYMAHAAVLHIVNDSFVFYFRHQHWTLLETAGVTFLSLSLTLVVATLLNRYIEVPARNAIRRFWEARQSIHQASQPNPVSISL